MNNEPTSKDVLAEVKKGPLVKRRLEDMGRWRPGNRQWCLSEGKETVAGKTTCTPQLTWPGIDLRNANS